MVKGPDPPYDATAPLLSSRQVRKIQALARGFLACSNARLALCRELWREAEAAHVGRTQAALAEDNRMTSFELNPENDPKCPFSKEEQLIGRQINVSIHEWKRTHKVLLLIDDTLTRIRWCGGISDVPCSTVRCDWMSSV